MRLLAAFALLIPSIAFGQPGADPSAPPPPPAAPEPGPPPAPPPGPGPGGPPGYAPPPPPPLYYAAPHRVGFDYHRGVTFEANLGVGFIHTTGDGDSSTSDAGLAGLDLGVGGWLSRQVALTFRISGVDFREADEATDGTVVDVFVGPSLQYWIDPHLWLGGGVGLAAIADVGGSCESETADCSVRGFGLDLRAGYSFGDYAHTFNASVEITPGVYHEDGTTETATGVAFLLGYQYL